MSKHKTFRLDNSLLARIEAVAKENGMSLSAAMRWVLKRGVAAVEGEVGTPAAAQQRRRMLSKGVV